MRTLPLRWARVQWMLICLCAGRPPPTRNAEGGPESANDQRSEVATELKVVFKFVPTVVTAVIMTTAISAAIKPYSIAVAPDSSERNLCKNIVSPVSYQTPRWPFFSPVS